MRQSRASRKSCRGIDDPEQHLRVAAAELVVAHHVQDLLIEREQAQRVGHPAAALAQHDGELLLGRAVAVEQLLEGRGLLDGVEVLALDVLEQGDLEGLGLLVGADDGRDLRDAGHARRAQAALAGDQAVLQLRGGGPGPVSGSSRVAGRQRSGAASPAFRRLTRTGCRTPTWRTESDSSCNVLSLNNLRGWSGFRPIAPSGIRRASRSPSPAPSCRRRGPPPRSGPTGPCRARGPAWGS